MTAFRKDPVINPRKPTATQETMESTWPFKPLALLPYTDSPLLARKPLLNDLTEDMEQELLRLLDPGSLAAGNDQLHVGGAFGESSTLAEKGDRLYPYPARLFESRKDVA